MNKNINGHLKNHDGNFAYEIFFIKMYMTVERVIEKHVLFCTEQSYNKIINSKITLHPQAPILRTLSSVKKTVKAALKLSIMFSV